MMMRAASIIALGIIAALAPPAASCERATRRVVHRVADPSAQWVAVVDEVEYANGLLTSVADRVVVRETASKDAAGTIVFSEDALPDIEKPTVAWEAGRLVITASRGANVLRREARAHGFEVEIRRR